MFKWARAHFFVGAETGLWAAFPAVEARGNVDLARIRDAAERVARSEGLEVVDVEWKVGKQRFLRVYIDRLPKPGETGAGAGVSHADCERVSQQLSVILDIEELVPGPRYILEISSPGLDRKLVKPADFERFTGRLARISTSEPVENAKFFEGRLAGFSSGKVRMELTGRERHTVEVPLELIRKANLVVEF
jgi:ribosome maturation factor RimP